MLLIPEVGSVILFRLKPGIGRRNGVSPSAEERVQFVLKVRRLLGEGRFTAHFFGTKSTTRSLGL
jgi:hypothetical protein